MRIIYMGSSYFSLEPLKALVNSCHNVVAIFTAKPKTQDGTNPIYEFANLAGIKILTPQTFRSVDAKNLVYSINADAIVVASYGLILPKDILKCKKYGCINVHPSDLPLLRGAAPIQHTLLSGMQKSAVCIMQMDEGIDTGPIFLKEYFLVGQDIYYRDLELLTSNLGAKLLLKVLDNIDNIKPVLQKGESSYAHKVKKEDAKINWEDSANKIYNQIRAFHLWPGCYFNYNTQTIKVLKAQSDLKKHNFHCGQIVDDNFTIACLDGFIYPETLQRSGKKPLNLKDFLLGFKVDRTIKAL